MRPHIRDPHFFIKTCYIHLPCNISRLVQEISAGRAIVHSLERPDLTNHLLEIHGNFSCLHLTRSHFRIIFRAKQNHKTNYSDSPQQSHFLFPMMQIIFPHIRFYFFHLFHIGGGSMSFIKYRSFLTSGSLFQYSAYLGNKKTLLLHAARSRSYSNFASSRSNISWNFPSV